MLGTPEEASAEFMVLIEATGGHVIVAGNPRILSVTLDSRTVQPGALYAALPGHVGHGAQFAPEAIARGAVAIITDAQSGPRLADLGVPVATFADPRAAVADICRRLDGAADSMTLVGVTGTNGKTSVAFMIAAGLKSTGTPTALVGTLGVSVGDAWMPSDRTTPESPDLHRIFRECRSTGIDHAVMEVSSIAACESRVRGLTFAVMVFTNLTQDHLDYHGTMEDYFQAKRSLFAGGTAHQAVICVDTAWGRRLADEADIPVVTVSTDGSDATWTATSAGAWDVRGPGLHEREDEHTPTFVIANRLCAAAALHACGVPAHHAWTAVSAVSVPGRMELVESFDGARVWVDYAHTPDAIERTLAALRDHTTGRLITVLGAGGDRDAQKRESMGGAAGRLSDQVIVTDDNPRSEDPAAIRAAVRAGARAVGAREVLEVVPREDAIRAALEMCRPGDAVAILGKGAETYQEIAGNRFPFDDRDVARRLIRGARP